MLDSVTIPSDHKPAVLIDPLAGNLDLSPLYELFLNTEIVRYFTLLARILRFFSQQEYNSKAAFDTQLAAMVCGFGEQVGYETLFAQFARLIWISHRDLQIGL